MKAASKKSPALGPPWPSESAAAGRVGACLAPAFCSAAFFILATQIFFKLAERRIDGDAGSEDVHFGFDGDWTKRAVTMVVDVIDGRGEHLVF